MDEGQVDCDREENQSTHIHPRKRTDLSLNFDKVNQLISPEFEEDENLLLNSSLNYSNVLV